MNGFTENARVCFLGDSITHINGFVSHIAAFYNEKLKDRKVNFYNCGVAGGGVETLLDNFDNDIMIHNPTHAVIMIGINDSKRTCLFEPRSKERYDKLNSAFEIYKQKLDILCGKLRENNIEITMCTQAPYDEYQDCEEKPIPGGCELLAGYAQYVREFASKNGFPVCDYHKFITRAMQEKSLYRPDRVHPNEDGQYEMARCFLAFQGFDIGEKKPLPEYMNRWCELVLSYRNLRATEFLIIKNNSLSADEKLGVIRDYIENGEVDEYREYFLELSNEYLDTKPRQKEIEDEINTLMEKTFKEINK